MLVAKGLKEGEMGSWYLVGTEILFCKMKRVLEMDGDDGCTVCEHAQHALLGVSTSAPFLGCFGPFPNRSCTRIQCFGFNFHLCIYFPPRLKLWDCFQCCNLTPCLISSWAWQFKFGFLTMLWILTRISPDILFCRKGPAFSSCQEFHGLSNLDLFVIMKSL